MAEYPQIGVRLSEEQRKAFIKLAESAGLSYSEVAREVLMEFVTFHLTAEEKNKLGPLGLTKRLNLISGVTDTLDKMIRARQDSKLAPGRENILDAQEKPTRGLADAQPGEDPKEKSGSHRHKK